ncbi:MAG: hypothetical protein H0X30_22040 [Anaerolineae bacterium]|nr:hypothetical protein [Anaerolineae bacterium]
MTVDPQLTPEIIREFVIASHFNLEKVRTLLADQPALLTVRHKWARMIMRMDSARLRMLATALLPNSF